MNVLDIIITIVIALAAFAAAAKIAGDKRAGKNGCGGDCSACALCKRRREEQNDESYL